MAASSGTPLQDDSPRGGIGGSFAQQHSEFLGGYALPTRASFAAIAGLFSSTASAANPQAEEVEDPSVDALAEFLFVRATPAATQRALVSHVANIVYSVGHEIFHVLLPYVNETVGGDVSTYGQLRAGQGVANLIGGLMFGAFGDAAGPKFGLIAAHASAAATSALVGVASSTRALFLTPLSASFMHGFQATMHVVSVNSDDASRARALGRVTAFYGLGFFAGSGVMLGALQMASPQHIELGVACVELLVVGFVVLAYPADLEAGGAVGSQGSSVSYRELLGRPGVVPALAFKSLLVFAGGTITFMTQQFALRPFGFTAREAALLMAYVGGLQLLSNQLASDGLPPRLMCWACSVSVGLSLLGMGLTPAKPYTYVLWLAPLTITYHAASVQLNSMMTLGSSDGDAGKIIGLSSLSFSVGPMLAVPAAVHIFKTHGFSAVPLASGLFLLTATAVMDVAGLLTLEPGNTSLAEDEAGATGEVAVAMLG